MSDKKESQKHDWLEFFPRGTWPVYKCERCGVQYCPTMVERRSDKPPSWWDEPCNPRKLTADDVQWLLGTGRFAQ